jgi:DNA-nicking Smr family endonuclease
MAKPGSRRGGASKHGASKHGASNKQSRSPDPEEARVFREAVRDVTPLAADLPRLRTHRRAPIVKPGSPGVAMRSAAALGGVAEMDDAQGVATVGADAPGAADPLSFRRPGVREQTLRHLRRGRYPVEDELDLHGLSQAAARDYLADFIDASRNAGLRCVRVVHGKGYRSGARGPVLKIAVNTWLRRHPDVLAFTSARPIDGGTGAAYVLLR